MKGSTSSSRPTFVWTIRDGAIERVSLYQEKEDALEDLGLSEQDVLDAAEALYKHNAKPDAGS